MGCGARLVLPVKRKIWSLKKQSIYVELGIPITIFRGFRVHYSLNTFLNYTSLYCLVDKLEAWHLH